MPSKFWNISKSIDKKIITHIKDASFFMKNPHISQCIDWRRTTNESNFWMSIPGGWIGELAIVLSVLEETVISHDKEFKEKALEILLDVVWWRENLSYHTDDNSSEWEIWCGHITLLLEKNTRKMYGLSDESADFIQQVIEQEKPTAIVNVLKWKHKEVWVIKVFSTHHSVHANFNDNQFFIYTPKIAYIRNTEIARKIYNRFVRWTSLSITADSLADMLQQKMNFSFYHTVHTLAPDLPVYRVRHSLNWSIKYLEQIADKAIDIHASNKDKHLLV